MWDFPDATLRTQTPSRRLSSSKYMYRLYLFKIHCFHLLHIVPRNWNDAIRKWCQCLKSGRSKVEIVRPTTRTLVSDRRLNVTRAIWLNLVSITNIDNIKTNMLQRWLDRTEGSDIHSWNINKWVSCYHWQYQGATYPNSVGEIATVYALGLKESPHAVGPRYSSNNWVHVMQYALLKLGSHQSHHTTSLIEVSFMSVHLHSANPLTATRVTRHICNRDWR